MRNNHKEFKKIVISVIGILTILFIAVLGLLNLNDKISGWLVLVFTLIGFLIHFYLELMDIKK